MAPSRSTTPSPSTEDMRSVPFPSENERLGGLFIRKSSSLDHLNTPVDHLSPSLPSYSPLFAFELSSSSSTTSPSGILSCNRFENDFGRVYSPSLSSSLLGHSNIFSISNHGHNGNGNGYGSGSDYQPAAAAGVGARSSFSSATDTARDFETAFCRDFYCCGTTLCDLHDLLQHYEECHVRFEEEEEDDEEEDYYEDDILSGAARDGGGVRGGGGSGSVADSEYYDEDSSWSESDSLPSSPSSTSPPPSRSLLQLQMQMEGLSGMSSGRSSRSASAGTGMSTGRHHRSAAVGWTGNHHHYMFPAHLHPFQLQPFPSQQHPFYDSTTDNNLNPTTHALEAFSNSYGGGGGYNSIGSNKRKAVVSLADLYVEDDNFGHGNDPLSSAFSNTVLRTLNSNKSNAMAATAGAPLAKRQALEANRRTLAAAAGTQFVSASATMPGSYPGVVIGGNGKPIGPLSGGVNPRSMASFTSHTSTPDTLGGGVQGPANVDWMRQRDEVFSILEDMTKPAPNASDENKPYRCSVAGCDKSYKNPNGLKYHNQHGHCSSALGDADNPETRPYVCTFLECGKRYKNLNGLKYHIEHTHPNLIAALRAHQAGLTSHPMLMNAGGYVNHQAAAMTIAAALTAVEASPVMALAANAIITAHNAAAAAAAVATANAAATVDSSASMEGDVKNEAPSPFNTATMTTIMTEETALAESAGQTATVAAAASDSVVMAIAGN